MSLKHTLICIVIGAVLWLIGALGIRQFGAIILDGGTLHIAVYVITLLTAPTLIWGVALAIGARLSDMLLPTTVATTTALFLDGTALIWTPQLYGGHGPNLSSGAAWLLWVVGALFFWAAILQRNPKPS